jgi:hypothetical protein
VEEEAGGRDWWREIQAVRIARIACLVVVGFVGAGFVGAGEDQRRLFEANDGSRYCWNMLRRLVGAVSGSLQAVGYHRQGRQAYAGCVEDGVANRWGDGHDGRFAGSG